MSRLRENPERLFEVFIEVGKPSSETEEPFILQKYPEDYNDEEVLKSVPKFAFPCDTERYTTTVDHFTFTLTDLDSKFKFGFCRHATGAQTCFCMISFLPWFEVFYNLLNSLAEITNRSEDNDLTHMLRAAYIQEVPSSGLPVVLVAQQEMFTFKVPENNKLPSIPASRNLTEYYNAMDTGNMMTIFASMLHERRIVVTSKKLSRLTAVVHAAASVLYPMYWQHLFIPVLPSFLIDYLSAPMPFVIGVHTNLMEKVRLSEMGDAVIVDADKNKVDTEYQDLDNLPDEMASYLKRHLKGEKVKNSMQGTGDVISKTFMMSLVKLIGGYRDALKFNEGETITFCPDAFVQSRPISMQPFLNNMLQLQIFQQFINDRLDMLNCGRGFSDIFEQECLLHTDKLNAQTRYNEWLQKMKKQGKKLQRGGKDVWSDLKDKAGPMVKEARSVMDVVTHRAGPAMSSAVESVKSQGKKAYSKARTKINDFKKDDQEGSPKPSKSVHVGAKTKSFSKARPVGIVKDRPSTIVGPPLTAQRPPRPIADTDHKLPPTPKIVVRQTSLERASHGYSDLEHRTSADDDVLMYSRVSCNLMTDPDIQQAIFKSASAENLPSANPALQSSDSSGTITSDSSLDGEDNGNVPYIDDADGTPKRHGDSSVSYSNLLDDDDSGIVMRTSSNTSLDKSRTEISAKSDSTTTAGHSNVDHNIPPPKVVPRKSVSPHASAGNALNDRLIQTSNISRDRPQPAPRKCSMGKGQTGAGDLLINLDVSGEKKEKSDLVSQFENLNNNSEYVLLREPKSSSSTPRSESTTQNRRSSISRTPAMKLAQDQTPKRPSIRRERSPVSPDETDKTGSMFDFDPLFGSSTQNTKPPPVAADSESQSDSLLKDWDLKDLTTMGNRGPPVSPGHLSYGAPMNYKYDHPAPPPRHSNVHNPTYFSSPTVLPTVPSKPMGYQSPASQMQQVPQLPPRNRMQTQSAAFSNKQTGFQQSPNRNKLETANQSDPFAGLLEMNSPRQGSSPQPRSSPQQQASPQPSKPKWETFD